MPHAPLYIGLSNPKSPTNVGAVLRAADCFAADAIRYTGVRYARAAQYSTDTQQADQRLPIEQVEDLLQDLPTGMQVVAVELVEGAIALPAFEHPEAAIYLFGPEDGTLEQALVDRADAVVYIPSRRCLNLAASVNVLLYDRQVKRPRLESGDALIRQSRDTNNTVKVRRGDVTG